MQAVYLSIVLAPLLGSLVAGFWGSWIGRAGAHWVTILGILTSFLLSLWVLEQFVHHHEPAFNGTLYTWLVSGGLQLKVGFLVDRLTVLMMTVVTFVSLMVHIYTIGYMAHEEGYQRFFSYIALFTFSMLMLVMSNNFLQLFFGWEAVGLVSYLLIGFYYQRETAIFANLKAFLVNRVGDMGFLLGIAAIALYFGTLDYAEVFAKAPGLVNLKIAFMGFDTSLMTLICLLLFVGAMGKSAQMPLHVWLPDSMEGPTPISALIHAATMVTAGIFMVARMSPLFELSDIALSVVMIVGASTAFFTGLIGVVQNDIKRVVAYSTLSQLGYMVAALGASAYAASIFHLMTHAFFKALLFLAAGSVIMAMHHEQDIRHMGGLKRHMPLTYWTSLMGSLALIGFPGFSGFFSKDAILEAVHHAGVAGSAYAYILLTLGVFVTALYSFRVFFLVFHGQGRMDPHVLEHLHESPQVVALPLVLLAIPSVILGALTIRPLLFGDWFQGILTVAEGHPGLHPLAADFHGAGTLVWHGLTGLPFLLAMAGLGVAWLVYRREPSLADEAMSRWNVLYRLLERKYGFDEFNDQFFAAGSRALGNRLFNVGDRLLIDGFCVNGSARLVASFAHWGRQLQTGYLHHYAAIMVMGVLFLATGYALL
ncbi:MAG: NADH-quinone oxidoreductase subunit L [Pseudomonadota bacterium]